MGNSAYIDTPPATERDYLIAKYMLMNAGLLKLDPHNGVKIPPARPPPSEYHFHTKGPGIIAGLCVCIFIMLAVTGLRLYVRVFDRRLRAGLDDILIIPGVLLAVAYPSLQIAMVQYGGAGRHMYDVTYEEYYWYKWLAAVSQIDFFVCVGIIKMSITAFNMRLTGLSSQKWKYAHWTFFGLLTCYVLIAFFLNVFQCDPPSYGFDAVTGGKRNTPAKCVNINTLGAILRSMHITMDYMLLAVPIIVLWNVQMDWNKKLRLFSVFSVGALACIGSVMTLVSKSRLKTDPLWNYTTLLAWTLVELTFGVLAASLPVLGALLPHATRSKAYDPHSGSGFSDKPIPSSRTRRLHSEASEEGIFCQDEVELKYSTRDTDSENGREGGKATIGESVSRYPAENHPWAVPYGSSSDTIVRPEKAT